MSLKDEITKAVGAHGMWKKRLDSAIDTGSSEFTPERVCADNQCDFGKWLYGGTITAADKTNPHYEAVRKRHAEFHKSAADVLKLALAGKKNEAHRLIGTEGRFTAASADLTKAMMTWVGSAG